MSTHPAIPPLSAFPPEYIAATTAPPMVGAAYAFIVLETIAFLMYFASRLIKKPTSHPEMPFLMIGGYICCVGLCIMSLLIAKIGGGGHHTLVVMAQNPYTFVNRLKIDKAVEFTYVPACAFPKFAILSLYMRLFAMHRQKVRYVCYGVGGIMGALVIYGLISPALSCRPFSHNWNKVLDPQGGSCFDILASYRWVSLPNVFTDLILMALCFPAIYQVQLPLITKISLFGTFAFGSIGLITSLIRFGEFFRNAIFDDHSWNGSRILLWTFVEPGVYFMAASLLTMRPLFRWVFADVKLPTSLNKISNWSWTRSSKPSKMSFSGINKENHIELQYSDSSVLTKAPEAHVRPVDDRRDGFKKLDDGSDRDVEMGRPFTKVSAGDSQDDPWQTSVLR